MGTDAREPSNGPNWNTGKVMYQAGLETFRVDFSTSPPSWANVGHPLTSTTSLDPILFTDHSTGRTFVSQLAGACSLMAFTDNDGASWTPNPIGCGLAAAADHQTVGGGPFAPGAVGPLTSYPHTVYYCAQAVAAAQCSVSQDGGLNFNPAVPIYNATQCGGLHGHEKSAPDGTAYVPNADCGGKAAEVVSKDKGLTWEVSKIPDSGTQDESDPSIGIGSVERCTRATRARTAIPTSPCAAAAPGHLRSTSAPRSESRTASSRLWWPATMDVPLTRSSGLRR